MHIIEHRGYQIKPHSSYPNNYIAVTAGKGGKIPDILSGMFTSPSIIKNKIDAYLVDKTVKGIVDDKEVN
jgi:hypothetical protein